MPSSILLIRAFVMATVAMATADEGPSHFFDPLIERDDVISSVYLFSDLVYSKVECAVRCSYLESCKIFTFNEGSRSCRGYSSRIPESSSLSVSPGTKAFLLTDPEYGCSEVKEYDQANGVHVLHDNGIPFTAYCDQTTDGGRWTVFVNRVDGSVDFNRTWEHYVYGFGDQDGEYWLGLQYLHFLTSGNRQYELRVDMGDWNGSTAYAVYDVFRVDGPHVDYVLHVTGYSGTAGDGLENGPSYWPGTANNMPFSTPDMDNDMNDLLGDENCAKKYSLGWWLNDCMLASPTGLYNTTFGVMWGPWTYTNSLKTMNFKIRPVN